MTPLKTSVAVAAGAVLPRRKNTSGPHLLFVSATAHRSDISTGIAASTLPRVIAESAALHANRLRLLQCV
jgi:hypothetical protein